MPTIHRVATSLSCVFAFAACFAQTPATFRTVTATERPSNHPILIDLNNDGIPDLIQQTVQYPTTTTSFTVRLATGSGTFGAPVSTSFATPSGRPTFTTGDFNGDGNADLIAMLPDSNQLVVFLGKGDGTFQPPKTVTAALPSGQQFGSSFVAADFTGDGKVDLAVDLVRPDPPSGTLVGGIYLLAGDGTGNFGTAKLLYSPPQYEAADTLVTGDFDGDGKADIAFLDDYYCDSEGPFCTSTLHILYNDGGSSFTDIPTDAASTSGDEFWLSTGDLNSDGRTDIVASAANPDATNSNQVYILYGEADRAFHLYTVTAPNVAALAIADFNGDTKMDLVGTVSNSDAPGSALDFFLAGNSEGAFTQQTYTLPNYPYTSDPVVGDLNRDTKPDLVLVLEKSTSTSILTSVLTTTSSGNWGSCSWPAAGQGIHVCFPQATIPPTQQFVRFNASANSFGQIRKMELWVDGTKIAEQYQTWGSRAWFDFSDPFQAGPHRGVIFATDIDGRLQKSAFTFNVGQFCSPPATAGVTICAPVNGSTVTSPVTLHAGAKVNGTLDHVEVWIDGKWYSNTFESTTVDEPLSLPAGTHRIAVLALNSAGQKWESAVSVTVK